MRRMSSMGGAKKGLAALLTAVMIMSSVPVMAQETTEPTTDVETEVSKTTGQESQDTETKEETTSEKTSTTVEKTDEKLTSATEEKADDETTTETEEAADDETTTETEEATDDETTTETEEEADDETTTDEDDLEAQDLDEDDVDTQSIEFTDIVYNPGSYSVHVTDLDWDTLDLMYEAEDSRIDFEAQYAVFEDDGSYTINLGDNPFFPYEIQFTYGGETFTEWFMDVNDTVEVGGHTFGVDAYFDNTVVTQLSLNIAGDEVIVYPEEKEFTNNGGADETSLMPLEEQSLSVDLTGYSPLELTSVSIADIFAGDVELQDTDKIVWQYNYYDDNDNYTISSSGDHINMSVYTYYRTSRTYEMIVGSADQLDLSNIRYLVSVQTTESEEWLNSSLVYTQDEDGTRTKHDLYEDSADYYDYNVDDRYQYLYTYNDEAYSEAYVSLVWDTAVYSKLNADNVKVYEGKYDSAQEAENNGKEITTEILATDMTQKDAGYKVSSFTWSGITLVLYHGEEAVGCLPMSLYVGTKAQLSPYADFGSLYSEGVKVNDTYSTTTKDGVRYQTIELYKEYPAAGEYALTLDYYDGLKWNDSAVTHAYVGQYESVAAATAAGAEDIREQLYGSTSGNGYKANYSDGVTFTVIAGEDDEESQTVCYVNIKTTTGTISKHSLSSNTLVNFYGLRDKDGDTISAYFVNSTEDSYSEYNYLTLLVDADVDLSNVAPMFSCQDSINLYTGDVETASPEVSGESYHDFSNGPVQYTASAEDKKNQRNYWLQIVKTSSDAQLYVNSLADPDSNTTTKDGVVTSTREMVIDSEHDNVHDILLINMSTETISKIKAELSSDSLVLDDYWTLDGTSDLLGYNGTTKEKTYGELQNMAKIRLSVKEGYTGSDLSGTLTISSDGTTLMVLNLTGELGDPEITTTEIPAAVKYVPYGKMIQNNNKYSWKTIRYTLYSGKLPEGMSLLSNGELYGVPKETGEFTFTVRMQVQGNTYTYDYQEYTLTVKQNTNENVDASTDEGYTVSTRIPDIAAGSSTDQLFVSEGLYSTFEGQGKVYIDGEELSQSEFTSESGSTKITILAETLNQLPKGTHTIGVEFRDENKDLKKAAQNFGVGVSAGSDIADDSTNNGGSSDNGSSDSSSNDSSDSSSSSSSASSTGSNSSTQTAATSTVAPVVTGEQSDAVGNTYVDVVMSPNNAVLKLELLQKYYGRNVYIMAHLGNGIGYSIDMENSVPTGDVDLSSSLSEVVGFAEGFVSFHMVPLHSTTLPFTVGLHINVGTEYMNHAAYLFVLDRITGTYTLDRITTVNEIGNVMLYLNDFTDVMVLVEQ